MSINLRQMFGDEALDAMAAVEELLHGVAWGRGDDPFEQFDAFGEQLEELRTNPVVTTLRSIAFEALAGLVLRSRGYEQVELGRVVPWENTTRDVDVYGIRGNKLRVIECKTYHRRKSIPAGEVRKFFTQTVPALKARLRECGQEFSQCVAEIWTTGAKGTAASEELYELNVPNGDSWSIKRVHEFESTFPKSVRRRGKELMNAIAASGRVARSDSAVETS
jgi:hypothetical protein